MVYFLKPTGVPSLETVVRTELRTVAGTQGDAFSGDVPLLPPGTYPIELRAKNCAVVDTGLRWTVP